MVQRLNNALFAHANGIKVLLMFVLAVSSLMFMALVITPAFQEATDGLRPFDLNFDIDAQQMYQDLPSYTSESRNLYLGFAIVDYIYPAAVALFFALLWAWMFSKTPNRLFDQLTKCGILLLPFLYMLVDWSENAGFLFVIYRYPVEHPGIGNLAGALKATKPMVLNVIVFITVIFAMVALARRKARE